MAHLVSWANTSVPFHCFIISLSPRWQWDDIKAKDPLAVSEPDLFTISTGVLRLMSTTINDLPGLLGTKAVHCPVQIMISNATFKIPINRLHNKDSFSGSSSIG